VVQNKNASNLGAENDDFIQMVLIILELEKLECFRHTGHSKCICHFDLVTLTSSSTNPSSSKIITRLW
jgi:hypothetical protein